MATKAALRTEYKAKRQGMSPAEVTTASQAICDQFMHADLLSVTGKPATIHVFLPIHKQHEIDTWCIIRQLWQNWPNCTLVTSVADFATSTLAHFSLTADTKLLTNRYGIPEPNPATSLPIPASAIDLVLVPLLVFDRYGHRVGYGKGFYDRFLAQCGPECLKVGLSLFEPVDQIEDVSATDVPLTHCLTPASLYQFS